MAVSRPVRSRWFLGGARQRSAAVRAGFVDDHAVSASDHGGPCVLTHQHQSASFDDVVRPEEYRRRKREAQGLGRLEVDDQLELGGLLDREIRRPGTLENADDEHRGPPEHRVGAVRVPDEAQKSGKDATEPVKKAGTSLEGAAKWSGSKLQEGAQASVDGLKKAGKMSADEIGKFFKGLGDGITDLGKKLSG